jgi:ribose transport system substrate-binding protein
VAHRAGANTGSWRDAALGLVACRRSSRGSLIAQQPADIGGQGIEQAVTAIEGRPAKEKIKTGYVTVDRDELDDAKLAAAAYKSSC